MSEQTIPAPGVHQLTDAEYFAGPLACESLSSTGARELLALPAKFRWNQQHPRAPKREFDVGHAAHKLVLGAGPKLVRFPGTGVNPEAWQKKDDIADVAAIRAEGHVPLKPSDWHRVHAMADALQKHPHAPRLLARGVPEQSMVWRDEQTGVLCRAKADMLRPDGVVDYKTADDVSDAALTKSFHNWGYYIQAPFYLRGFRATHPGVEPFFAFIAQEKEPPYLVRVVQLGDRALAHGDRKAGEAMATYARCVEADDWPGYPLTDKDGRIPEIDLPGWVRTEEW
jgi:hypothetical protein